jgi:hypothetical protein
MKTYVHFYCGLLTTEISVAIVMYTVVHAFVQEEGDCSE